MATSIVLNISSIFVMTNLAAMIWPNVIWLADIFIQFTRQFNFIFVLPLICLWVQCYILCILILELHKFASTWELRRWVQKVALNMLFGALSVDCFLVFRFLPFHLLILFNKVCYVHFFNVFWMISGWYLRNLRPASMDWRFSMVLIFV